VESSPAAVKVIHENLDSLQIKCGFEVLQARAPQGLQRLEADSFSADIIFLDPPYRLEPAYRDTLEFLAGSALLKPYSIVIAEHQKKVDPGERLGSLTRYRALQQGDAALSFYRREST
jgi:16S rRNA G966 N2-methylase RsmD